MSEREEQTERYSNKKIDALRRRRERRVKDLEELGEDAHENITSYYKLQVRLVDYDIEDAVKSEAKRQTRKALRHIKKRLDEVEELRRGVVMVLSEDEILGWTDRMNFKDELGKTHDLDRLIYGK